MSISSLLPYILTGLTVSILHASIPTHWLPFVLAGRAQKWSYKRTLSVLFVAGMGHILTTSLIGAGIVWFGLNLHEHFEESLVLIASVIVFLFGAYNIVQYLRGHKHSHCDHNEAHDHDYAKKAKDGWAILSLLLLLTLSPCHAFIPVYISAWATGWNGFYILTITLAMGTLAAMMFFTSLAFFGLKQLKLDWLEDHEKLVAGILLIALAFVVYFSESVHHHASVL